jgi:hypothetical protein
VFSLFAALSEFKEARSILASRLKDIPGGTRDMAMLHAVLGKLIDKIILTIPVEKRVSMAHNMQLMFYQVYQTKPVSTPTKGSVVVDKNDFKTLLDIAHYWSCGACDKDCNKCDLGKALDHSMYQCRGKRESWSNIDLAEEWTDEKAGGTL